MIAFGGAWHSTSASSHDLPELAGRIRQTVRQWTGIPVSVGIAPTKTLAKIANNTAKKKAGHNGVCILNTPETWEPVLHEFDVGEVWGIGPQYKKLLNKNGITTALEFSRLPETWLRKHMSVVGARTAGELTGRPCLELELHADPKKGITVSRSFGKRITELPELEEALASYVSRAAEKLRREKLAAKHMLVFMHTSPFAKDAAKDPYYAPSLSFALPLHTNYTDPLRALGIEEDVPARLPLHEMRPHADRSSTGRRGDSRPLRKVGPWDGGPSSMPAPAFSRHGRAPPHANHRPTQRIGQA